MSFTPNMSPKQVADLDNERGKKFYDPEDTWPSDDHPTDKKPWLNKTPVNKSGEEDMSGTKILKSFFKSYEEDEDMEDISKPLAKKSNCCDGLERFVPKEDKEDESVEHEEHEEEAKKALSSRSMHIPRPQGPYDPFSIMRSATTVTTRQHSGLNGPSGVAALVGETLRGVEDDAVVRTKQDTYKSCNFHGLVHRQASGCGLCNSDVSKSLACDGCGKDKEKIRGGALLCKDCG